MRCMSTRFSAISSPLADRLGAVFGHICRDDRIGRLPSKLGAAGFVMVVDMEVVAETVTNRSI